MKGYTAKVGLRKSRLHFDMLRARRVVRQVRAGSLCASAGLMDTIQVAKAKVDALPAGRRAYLEGEFQRAEQEAAAIVRHGLRGAS